MYSNHYFSYYDRRFAENHIKSLRHNGIKACIRKKYEESFNDSLSCFEDIPVWVIYTKITYLEVLKYLQFLETSKK